MSYFRNSFLLLVCLGMLACQDNNSTNQPPSVNAGPDTTVLLSNNTVQLSAIVSDDGRTNSTLSLQWRLLSPQNTNVIFSATDTTTVTVTLPQAGIYVFEIMASDGELSNSDSVTITLLNDTESGLSQRPDNQTCIAPADAPTLPSSITLEKAFPNLPDMGAVTTLLQAPGDNNDFYAVVQSGVVKRFANSSDVSQSSDFIDISGQTNSVGEQGLLGMAFHPDYANNSQIYLSYTRTDTVIINGDPVGQLRSYISRFTLSQGNWLETPILVIDQPAGNHNGGNIAFGADSYLYIGFGDGGGGNDQLNNPIGHGQDTTTLLGAMLRIDVDAETPYGIPPDNPFADELQCLALDTRNNGHNCPEIFAYGLRNPWRWSFDSMTNALWLGDVGQSAREEIDIIELGNNYGWRIMEGAICTPGVSLPNCDTTGLTLPVIDYIRYSSTHAVVGGYVYRGNNSDLEFLAGTYLYADTYTGEIWGLSDQNQDGNYTNSLLYDFGGNIYSFAQDNQGELYILSPAFSAGVGNNIYKIAADLSGPTISSIAPLLSQTGCVDQQNPTQAASGLIPFDVINPLWSDNAQKNRYMALPNDSKIEVDANGDFIFPIGTVLVKDFSLNDRIVETRLLMRHNDRWGGYSYEWQYDQQDAPSDAVLLTSSKIKFIENQNWFYPSRGQCFDCHVDQSNIALGPEVLQLNHSLTYAGTGNSANQVTTYEAIGLMNTVDQSLKSLSLSALDDDSVSFETRAKSYLHSNCAHCHQPEVTPIVNMDLRFLTPLQQMNVCNSRPLRDELGHTDPYIIDSAGTYTMPNSILIARMETAFSSGVRMPPLATEQVHLQALEVFKNWVNELDSCP